MQAHRINAALLKNPTLEIIYVSYINAWIFKEIVSTIMGYLSDILILTENENFLDQINNIICFIFFNSIE